MQNEQELIAEWIIDHPGATREQARAAVRAAHRPTERLLPMAQELSQVNTLTLQPDPNDPMAVGAGLEGFGADDVRIPQLKIRQAQTKNAEGVPEGHWFLTSDLEGASPARNVVFLEMKKERSLLLPYAGGDAADAMIHRIHEKTGVRVPADWKGPVCYSRDRIQPTPQDGIDLLCVYCDDCPMARWRTVRGRRIQDCGEFYRILLYDLESQLPAVYYAHGSAIRPTRDLLTNLQVACRRHKLPAYGFSFSIATKRPDEKDSSYHVPVFGRPVPLSTNEEVQQFAGIRLACASVRVEEDQAVPF